MTVDILKWLVLYLLVLFAFGCGMNQLLWYYADLEYDKCYSLPGGLPNVEGEVTTRQSMKVMYLHQESMHLLLQKKVHLQVNVISKTEWGNFWSHVSIAFILLSFTVFFAYYIYHHSTYCSSNSYWLLLLGTITSQEAFFEQYIICICMSRCILHLSSFTHFSAFFALFKIFFPWRSPK